MLPIFSSNNLLIMPFLSPYNSMQEISDQAFSLSRNKLHNKHTYRTQTMSLGLVSSDIPLLILPPVNANLNHQNGFNLREVRAKYVKIFICLLLTQIMFYTQKNNLLLFLKSSSFSNQKMLFYFPCTLCSLRTTPHLAYTIMHGT